MTCQKCGHVCDEPATYCPVCGGLVQGKSLLILGITFTILLFAGFGYWTVNSSYQPFSGLLRHRVNDVSQEGQSVWVFLVADANLSDEAARQLVDHYRSQYPEAKVLNIDILCDDKYTSHSFADKQSAISDSEFYAHVLFSYIMGPVETVLHTRSNPIERGQGSACGIPGESSDPAVKR
jgi:hypothetical protein